MSSLKVPQCSVFRNSRPSSPAIKVQVGLKPVRKNPDSNKKIKLCQKSQE